MGLQANVILIGVKDVFHYLVSSSDEVDEVIAKAVAAGGSEVKAPASAKWGGYFGYFADLDGYLWKVAAP